MYLRSQRIEQGNELRIGEVKAMRGMVGKNIGNAMDVGEARDMATFALE